jgi:HPt (histidine-containing phosphotransfer) domain-containing protein
VSSPITLDPSNAGGPAAPPSVPAVDLTILNRTSNEMGADTAAGRQDLIQAYLEQGDAWIEQLAAAAQHGDGAQAHRIAHALHSSSALIGALPLVGLLDQIATRTVTESAGLRPVVAATVAEYQRVAAVLRTEFPPSTP